MPERYSPSRRAYDKRVRPRKRRERKAAYVAALSLAKEGPCSDCALSFPPVCMDFDHRDPLAKGPGPRGNRDRHKLNGAAGVARIVAACDLVCACCHRLRTESRGDHLLKQPDRPRTSSLSPGRQEKTRMRRREAVELIRELKGAPCLDCGRRYPSVCMDFDHVRGEKLMNVSVMPTRLRVLSRIRDEVEKCDLVCANCHRVRTEGRRVGCILTGHADSKDFGPRRDTVPQMEGSGLS